MDVRKSISNALLAISNQYAMFLFIFLSKWPPWAANSHYDLVFLFYLKKSIGFFHSMAASKMNLIMALVSQLRETQALECGVQCVVMVYSVVFKVVINFSNIIKV